MSTIQSQLINTTNEFNQALAKEKGSNLDKDAFMLLLVTQFKHQDPLNPMEDKEFVAQLSQFTSLEQLMNLNTSMETLTNASQQQQMINATSYIGKSVDANGSSISKVTDTKTNTSSISNYRYAIGEETTGGTIFVYDSNNQLVNSYTQGPQMPGTYDFNWDGKSFVGDAPDGVYSMVLNFKNKAGDSLQYDAVVSGKVTGAMTQNGNTVLTLEDGRTVSLAGVRRITDTTTVKNEDGDTSSST